MLSNFHTLSKVNYAKVHNKAKYIDKDRFIALKKYIETTKVLPKYVFIFNCEESVSAIHEANILKIPIIALCTVETDTTNISIPIMGNMNSNKSISDLCKFLLKWIKAPLTGKYL
jgi:ribosomal protein S2